MKGLPLFLSVVLLAGAVVVPAAASPVRLEQLTRPSPFHGVHGLAVTRDGRLLAGSVIGAAIHEVDPVTGATRVVEPPPSGMADDLDEGPDGTLAWTSTNAGRVHARTPGGPVRVLATGLPGVNAVAWSPDGRLFASQVFGPDALLELDPAGVRPPRTVLRDLGGLNGFDFGPDGWLHGPLWSRGEIVRIDVDRGVVETVARGFRTPGAVAFDSAGRLFALETGTGGVYRVDAGGRVLVARQSPGIDNLVFDADDRLFVSNMADNSITELDPSTGDARTVLSGDLAVAADLALGEDGVLHVADGFALRRLRAGGHRVRDTARMYATDLLFPTGVDVAGDLVATAGWTAGAVQVLDRRTGSVRATHGGFDAPMDVVRLPDGHLLVSSHGSGSLLRVDPVTGERRTAVEGLDGPTMMAAAGGWSVYVSETTGGRVTRVDAATGARSTVAAGLDQPEGLAVAPGGALVVAEVGRARLVAVDPRSGALAPLRDGLPIGFRPVPDTPPVYVPTGVAVSGGGDVYFTSDVTASLYRLRGALPARGRVSPRAGSGARASSRAR
ncbi:hypothetical protein [Saccharothrix xinjiangensis]|uniref:Uncharacterized protein n=1 Tax=Saccharothrix xinjiangensis TaxID=204798 RepID=A0ABV9Y0D3_9PSEU